MKTTAPLLFVFFLSSIISYGQIIFEKGYLVDNENQKTECLIKNIDWRKNPKEFEYKLNESDDVKKGDITHVKEFGILGYSKYIRVDVKVDRSPTLMSNLSAEKNPIWHQEQLFLKVLVQGKASLYIYGEDNFTKFFYSVTDSPVKQLIYKEYLIKANQLASNYSFRQQLMTEVRCEQTPVRSIEQIGYNQQELERYFKRYNECLGDSSAVYDNKKVKKAFNLRLTSGINYSSLSMHNSIYNRDDIDFDNQLNFRFGLEAELILPYNKNKWGIILEPAYQYFDVNGLANNKTITGHYQSIDFSLGLRHYLFLNEKTKFFLNGYFNSIASIDFNSKINSYPSSMFLDIRNRPNLGFGGGVIYRRVSAEIRYYTNQGILNYMAWDSDYKKISFIVGYKITGHN